MAWIRVSERLPDRSGYYDTIGQEKRCKSREQVWFDIVSGQWKHAKYPVVQWNDESYVGVID